MYGRPHRHPGRATARKHGAARVGWRRRATTGAAKATNSGVGVPCGIRTAHTPVHDIFPLRRRRPWAVAPASLPPSPPLFTRPRGRVRAPLLLRTATADATRCRGQLGGGGGRRFCSFFIFGRLPKLIAPELPAAASFLGDFASIPRRLLLPGWAVDAVDAVGPVAGGKLLPQMSVSGSEVRPKGLKSAWKDPRCCYECIKNQQKCGESERLVGSRSWGRLTAEQSSSKAPQDSEASALRTAVRCSTA